MKAPQTISVVIPFFNAEKTLPKTLESIKKALEAFGTKEAISILFVNNNSTDSSKEILSNWVKKINVRARVIDEPQQGVAHARNCGVSHSASDFIAFIDADDEIDSSYFLEVISALDSSTDLLILNPANIHRATRSLVDGKINFISCSHVDALRLLDGWWSWRFVTRTKLLKASNFIGNCYEDFGVFPVLLAASRNIRSIKKPLYLYKRNLGSLTSHISDESIAQLELQYTRLANSLKKQWPSILKRVNSDFFEQLTLYRVICGRFPIRNIGELAPMIDFLSTQTARNGLPILLYRVAYVVKRKFFRLARAT